MKASMRALSNAVDPEKKGKHKKKQEKLKKKKRHTVKGVGGGQVPVSKSTEKDAKKYLKNKGGNIF